MSHRTFSLAGWWLFVTSAFFFIVGGPVAAQEANEILLDATYLGAPTDWRPADAGVPVVIKMDGPDIIPSPEDWPRKVRVRRGGDVSSVGSEKTTHFNQRHRVFDPEEISRLSAELRSCQDPWSRPRFDGRWHLTASDGSELAAGDVVHLGLGYSDLPFFRRANAPSDIHYAKIGDHTFFTPTRPKLTTSQTFATGTDRE